MPTVRLTDLGVAHLKPQLSHVDYWDKALPTFGVRVSPKGTKTFILKLHNGRRAIGRYHPDILPLAKARAEAKRLIAEKTLGRIRPGSIPYEAAVQLFIEDRRRKCRQSTCDGYEWLLSRFSFGQVSYVTCADITPQLTRIKSPSTAGHALIALRIFFNWAVKRQYRETNPTLAMTPHQSKRRERILTDDQLRAVWNAANEIGGSYGTLVKLLILTGQRRGEIAALRTSYVDGSTVVLPAELVKNKRRHRFPLCTEAAELLRSVTIEHAANDAFFFPARGHPDRPLNGWSKNKKLLDRLSGVCGFTLHDLRRTFRTKLGKLGIPRHVAERILNHVSAVEPIEWVYDQYDYLPEMRQALEAYEADLIRILHAENPEKLAA